MPIFEWRHRLARKSVTIKMNTALTALWLVARHWLSLDF
jgi:hypothetical protein